MNILHIQYTGNIGGIEKLSKDIGLKSKKDKNTFMFVHAGGEICEEMKSAGLDVCEYNYKNSDVIPVYKEIKNLIKQRKISVLVVHSPAPLVWLACLLYAKEKEKIKMIVYVHNGYLQITERSSIRKYMYNMLLNKCDHIVAISKFVKNTVLENTKIKPKKISVVYNGIDTTIYGKSDEKQKKAYVKIIYVGRLIEEKGVQVLIKAMALLRNKDKFRLDIVGDGPYRKELEEQIKGLNLDSTVKMVGNKRDIPKRLSESDIFVHPAIWDEGFGITIVEAMRSGLICVAFAKGAIPEIIDNNISGFLVEEVSQKNLAEKIEYAGEIVDLDIGMSIQKNAMEKAKEFSIENLTEKLHEIYESL